MVITDTPKQQLHLLSLAFADPLLPRQDLARLLQLRVAWHPSRGIPAQGNYAYNKIVSAHRAPAPKPEAPVVTLVPKQKKGA